MKRIIIIRGVQNTGKTTKIIEIAEWITDTYELEKTLEPDESGDILGVLKIGKLTIGFNSSGDNKKEILKIEKLKDENGNYPDIIICASRTKGKTQKYFKANFGYSNQWFKVYHTVKRRDSIDERERRDHRVVEEIKTRLIGLKKL